MSNTSWAVKLANYYYFKVSRAQDNQLQRITQQFITTLHGAIPAITDNTLRDLISNVITQLQQNPSANVDWMFEQMKRFAAQFPIVNSLYQAYRRFRLQQNMYAQPEGEIVSEVAP